eukprot:jgi/Chrzof1/4649/Cz14g21120.t1
MAASVMATSRFWNNPDKGGLACSISAIVQSINVFSMMPHRYVKTTDGTTKEFSPGDVLFQDNTSDCPADKEPKHFSGVVGNQPCQQMIVQVSRKPEVDKPGSL